MICNHFRENWELELPKFIGKFSKKNLTFIFARDSQGNKSFPYCRYGYDCKYRFYDCPIPYFKSQRKPIQLTLF